MSLAIARPFLLFFRKDHETPASISRILRADRIAAWEALAIRLVSSLFLGGGTVVVMEALHRLVAFSE